MMTAGYIGDPNFPTEWREFEGDCRGCGTEVRWKALWSERGAFPAGTPLCDQCGKDGQAKKPGQLYDIPILQALHDVGVHVPNHRHTTLDAWDDSEDMHLSAARRFVTSLRAGDAAGKGLYLHGSTGNGKTSLAVACVRELIAGGMPRNRIWFRKSRTFLRQLGDAYKSGGAEELVGRAKSVQLLVVDELGKEPPTDHSIELLADVIEERMGGTIITSNYDLAGLSQRFIDRPGMEHLVSRLGDTRFAHLAFKGRDRRFR